MESRGCSTFSVNGWVDREVELAGEVGARAEDAVQDSVGTIVRR